jgi:hypothetical protein
MEEAVKVALQVIAAVYGMPSLHAVLVGLFAGVGGANAVSNYMPPNTDTAMAKRITALVSGGLTLIVALLVHVSVLTLAWGLTMAIVAPAVHGALVRVIIKRWPWAAPESILDHADAALVQESKNEKGSA